MPRHVHHSGAGRARTCSAPRAHLCRGLPHVCRTSPAARAHRHASHEHMPHAARPRARRAPTSNCCGCSHLVAQLAFCASSLATSDEYCIRAKSPEKSLVAMQGPIPRTTPLARASAVIILSTGTAKPTVHAKNRRIAQRTMRLSCDARRRAHPLAPRVQPHRRPGMAAGARMPASRAGRRVRTCAVQIACERGTLTQAIPAAKAPRRCEPMKGVLPIF